MDVNFKFNEPSAVEPIRIEQVFAEKPGGGVVKAPTYDVPATTAVSANADGTFSVIKSYRLVQAVTASDTSIKIAKGSGVAKGDVIATGKKGVACTAVNSTNAEYDTVTVTLGIELPAGTALYQAASASADAAEPVATPVFVTGNTIKGGEGDKAVRLINGANLRKETACIASEVAALLPTINLV